MKRFLIENPPIEGLMVIQRQPLGDARGYLERLFCEEDLQSVIEYRRIVQINHTLTEEAGTVRGMHFQRQPYAEMKLVSCLRGKVFDVAIDLRENSPTFLQWYGEVLTEKNYRTFVIPEGFAHGFQTLSDNCELLYLHTAPYLPSAEGGVNALDPSIGIEWPIPITVLSDKDRSYSLVCEQFTGLLQ